MWEREGACQRERRRVWEREKESVRERDRERERERRRVWEKGREKEFHKKSLKRAFHKSMTQKAWPMIKSWFVEICCPNLKTNKNTAFSQLIWINPLHVYCIIGKFLSPKFHKIQKIYLWWTFFLTFAN